MYDIIGDVHGHADKLAELLEKLGFQKRFGVYHHQNRKAIFLGDFVDRGPKIKETLKMVKHMVEEESALAVLGNHEYNLLSLFTNDENGKSLRPKSLKNLKQVKISLKSFNDNQKKLNKYLDWFKQLPIYLELDGLRIVHATWSNNHINWLKTNYPENRLTNELLIKSANHHSKEHKVLATLLKGVEVALPKGVFFEDTDGNLKNNMRVKWWENPEGKTIRDLATKDPQQFPNLEIDLDNYTGYYPYPKSLPPLFLGHYCLNGGEPYLLEQNICCVDFCVVKTGSLTAYQWNGEKFLKKENFIRV